ncbi:MAG: hypothetical protein AB7I04_11305 [Pseudomonadales bacterium]
MTSIHTPFRSHRHTSAAAPWLLACAVVLLGGCVSETVRIVDMTPPEQMEQVQSESELLDIGIAIFDPNVPEEYDEQIKQLIQPEIRRAEANYMPYHAKNLLQSTGNWGAVRVVPRPTNAVDVTVTGRILHSDGESMGLELSVHDATGKEWFTKEYEALASKYAYDEGIPQGIDPFQTVYKDFADDLLAYRKALSREQIEQIRATAEMKFAQDFAPDAFSDHISQSKNGDFELVRLPAEDDPMLGRVRKVREREYLFIDTLDEYYENFHRDMYPSYQNWRRATYEEAIAYKELRAQSRARAIGGAVAIAGGIAAMSESSNAYVDTSGIMSVMSGAMLLKTAITKRDEAQIHAEVLEEVGVAAEGEIMPHTIDLENQSVRLQGNVDEQYDELRGILRRIYFADLGLPDPAATSGSAPAADAAVTPAAATGSAAPSEVAAEPAAGERGEAPDADS